MTKKTKRPGGYLDAHYDSMNNSKTKICQTPSGILQTVSADSSFSSLASKFPLILCARNDEAVARYALEGLPNKVMAAEYRTVLPDEKELVAEIERTQAMLQDRKRLALANISRK